MGISCRKWLLRDNHNLCIRGLRRPLTVVLQLITYLSETLVGHLENPLLGRAPIVIVPIAAIVHERHLAPVVGGVLAGEVVPACTA